MRAVITTIIIQTITRAVTMAMKIAIMLIMKTEIILEV